MNTSIIRRTLSTLLIMLLFITAIPVVDFTASASVANCKIRYVRGDFPTGVSGTWNPPVDSNVYQKDTWAVVLGTSSLATPSYNGVLIGWEDQLTEERYAVGDPILVDREEITLEGIWQRLWTVTYHPNGGTPVTAYTDVNRITDGGFVYNTIDNTVKEDLIYTIDNTINEKGDPRFTRSDHTFIGWASSSGYPRENTRIYNERDQIFRGSDPDDDFKLGSNILLYAQWEKYCKVEYNANGGAGTVPTDAEEYYLDDQVTIMGNTNLTRTGFRFDGWTLTRVSPGANFSGTIYNEFEQKQVDKTNIDNGKITFYAYWSTAYKITYNKNGADGGSVPIDNDLYAPGEEVLVEGNTNKLTRKGYRFVGWTESTKGTGTVYNKHDIITMPKKNITLYAKWDTAYTVKYHKNGANGGTVPKDDWSYAPGSRVNVSDNTGKLVRAGYVFAGWTLDSAGKGTVYKRNDKITINKNITLYAKWTKVYKITYDNNGATGGVVPKDSKNYVSGSNATVQNNPGKLVRKNFKFAGWTLNKAGSGVIYKNGDKINITSKNVTLYAKWVKNLVDVKKPSIRTQPKKSTTVNRKKALTLNVRATASGKLTYQWYSNTINKASGGKKISKATQTSYKVPTSSKGTRYYYCVITHEDKKATGKQTITSTTKVAKVVVR